jgi:hypothetical protein
LFHLLLRTGACLVYGFTASVRGLLAASFLGLENLLSRFAQTLLVIGSAGFGSCNIRSRFFHRSLRAAAPFGKNRGQRTVNQKCIKNIESRKKNDRWHASEQ